MPEVSIDLKVHPFLQAVANALQGMDKAFVTLSRLKWNAFDNEKLKRRLIKRNLQERPYAYEFYHQMRKLWEGDKAKELGLERLMIQAEVNKSYQDIPYLKKMPDFLVHQVDNSAKGDQFAVFEFKVASRLGSVKADLRKLIDFKHILSYSYGIEVVIGTSEELKRVPAKLDVISNRNRWAGTDYNLVIVYFNVDTWTASVRQREYPKK